MYTDILYTYCIPMYTFCIPIYCIPMVVQWLVRPRSPPGRPFRPGWRPSCRTYPPGGCSYYYHYIIIIIISSSILSLLLLYVL